MISTTAYILISTIVSHGQFTQSAVTFADKASCEKVALRQDFVLKDMHFNGKWNLTCHPYTLNGESK